MNTGFFKDLLVYVRTYCQELLINFGFDLLTIVENRDVPRDGELSKEDKKKLEDLIAAETRKKILEEDIFEVFILISEALKNMMALITDKLR